MDQLQQKLYLPIDEYIKIVTQFNSLSADDPQIDEARKTVDTQLRELTKTIQNLRDEVHSTNDKAMIAKYRRILRMVQILHK